MSMMTAASISNTTTHHALVHGKSTTTSTDSADFVRYETNGLLLCHLKSPINSTQDESRVMLSTMVELPKTLAVLADIQLQGRGTQVGASCVWVRRA
jgi:hypothetical protein